MPIYEYRCKSCGHELEKLQRMSEDPLTDCPSCGEAALQRLISAAGFRLKGSGWYETDFKTGKKRNLIGADSGDKSKSSDASPGTDAKSSDSPKSEKSKEKPASDSGGKPASKDKTAA